MSGGLIPLLRLGHDRYAVEQTWWVEITWLRYRFWMEATR